MVRPWKSEIIKNKISFSRLKKTRMIKKKFTQIMTLLKDAAEFIMFKLSPAPVWGEKVLLVDFKNPNLYHRFFYLLLKFYKISGYQIIYPMTFVKFRNLRNGDPYLALIIKEENLLSIKDIKPNLNFVRITDEQFSEDYFKNYFFENNLEKNSFHIPMSFHPLMYHKNLWNNKVRKNENRINSIFCYGNFDDKAYLEIEKTGFNIMNRRKLYEFFRDQSEFYLLENQENLNQILSEQPIGKYIFAEKYVYPLPMEQVQTILSKFRFFLCCPGVVMPLCHNIIEAMSVGTVPIIQREYAQVMYPQLENGKNAIIFENIDDLKEIIKNNLFTTSEINFKIMSDNVLQYYRDFLSPESVVEKINHNLKSGATIYLNAEHRSIKFLN